MRNQYFSNSHHLSSQFSVSLATDMVDKLDRFHPMSQALSNLTKCPKSSVPFLGDRDQTFGNDMRAFGSGYAIFAHLTIFSVFALVGATNNCNRVCIECPDQHDCLLLPLKMGLGG